MAHLTESLTPGEGAAYARGEIPEKPRRTRGGHAPVSSDLTLEARIRLPQIIGDSESDPPLPGIFPVGRTTIYRLIQQGKFPPPLKPFPGCRASYWKYGDVLAAIQRLEEEAQTTRYETPLARKRRTLRQVV